VVSAGEEVTPQSREALASLCALYWHPVYAFIRCRGHSRQDAEDLTQDFFARLLEKHYLRTVQRERGRFRTFLLTLLRRFLANELDRIHAQKRGGGQAIVPLDIDTAEKLCRLAGPAQSTPEEIFERRWAAAVLERVSALLEHESSQAGKGQQFECLGAFLTGENSEASYRDAARRLGMTEAAVKMAVHRLRKRFGELLRAELARVVLNASEIDDEIHHLLSCLDTD
jgi:RNA polymerase sigma-70 factor (ECF subfamily)